MSPRIHSPGRMGLSDITDMNGLPPRWWDAFRSEMIRRCGRAGMAPIEPD